MAIAIGLLKMLLELQESRKSGALDVAGPAARVRLFVENGRLVYADEGTVGETLGRLLVREHVLDQDQCAAAIEWMADLRAAGKKAMLGEVFVELGLLTRLQVHAALAALVQQKAMRALGWSSARLRFIESPGPLVLADRFATPIEPLVVAALRLADRERVEALLTQARERHAALRGDHAPGGGSAKQESLSRIDAFQLQSAEDGFARGLDATRTVRELLEDEDAAGVDRLVILAALLLTDVLDLHAAASMRAGATPKSVPRPSPGSRRLPAVAAAPVPSRATAPPSSREAPTSTVSVGPETPAAPMAPLLAEKAYLAGKRLVRANRMPEAVKELRRAASLYPAAEYDLWAAWAEARADEGNEEAHAGALRACADLAIEQDTERGFATFVLAYLARRAGSNAVAEALLERARALDPEAIQDGWEGQLLGPPATYGTRSAVRALAPLLTTPGAPAATTTDGAVPDVVAADVVAADVVAADVATGAAKSEASGAHGSVATLRGIAAADALEDARGRLEREEARGRVKANAKTRAKEYAEARVKAKAKAKAKADANEEAEVAVARVADATAEVDPRATVRAADASSTARRVEAPEPARRGWVVALAVIGAVGAGVFFATLTTSAGPGETGSALASASLAFTPVASAPGPPPSTTSPEIAAVVDAAPPSYASGDGGLAAVDATKGILSMPASANSHRVYVDGRLAGIPPPPIVVGCGRHVVKIGSRGREQSVVVPCGGTIIIAYP